MNARLCEVRDLSDPALYLNRELSWLEFNQRILDEARDPSVRLLERLEFLSIAATNLDEFFMVRVAGLLERTDLGVDDVAAEGLRVPDQLTVIAARTQRMLDEMSDTATRELAPLLEREGVVATTPEKLSASQRAWLRTEFFEQIHPILTPLALDPGHPFPNVSTESLHLVVMLSSERDVRASAFAVVEVPSVLPRLVAVPSASGVPVHVWLEDVITEFAGALFHGFRRLGAWSFRVIRDADVPISDDDAEDLLEMIEAGVRRRDRGRVVSLHVDASAPADAVALLIDSLEVDPRFVFRVRARVAHQDVADLGKPLAARRELRDPVFVPARSPAFPAGANVFECIAKGDVLLHHPYESFDPVVELLQAAALDPDVLAIKQTLYRTSGDSPFVDALIRAAENGKHVVVAVELTARFEEENNIEWARKLEAAGVTVVYGLVGLKTHGNVMLVVRREAGHLRRYVHLGTGNYNPTTARSFCDLSVLTARDELGEDATSLFNLLTSCTGPRTWNELVVAPLGLRERVLAWIDAETANALRGMPARIIAKLNSLVDEEVIRALYRASAAGVQIDLVVRGICCLRPGVPGVSSRIRVRRVVDRFLEHVRLFYFEAGGRREVYASSGDWTPSHFDRRIEVLFPILPVGAKHRAIEEILGLSLADDAKASELASDGSYVRVRPPPGVEPMRSQRALEELARESARQARARVVRPFSVVDARGVDSRQAGSAPRTVPRGTLR